MEKKRLKGNLAAAFQYLRRAFQESVFLHRQIVIGRENGFKIREERSRLDVRAKFFSSLLIGW